jgi:hypothetical protein
VIGFDADRMIAAYAWALKSGKNDRTMFINGRGVKHYGLTTPQEFLAGMSEVCLYVNDYYPFVAAELRLHDPKTYKLMCSIYAKPKK